MTKARTLADFISDGSPLADGTVDVSEVSGAAPLASPNFTGNLTVDTDTLYVDSSSDEVGINTSAPGGALDVRTANNGRLLVDLWGSQKQYYNDNIVLELNWTGSGDSWFKQYTNISNVNSLYNSFSSSGAIFNEDGANRDFRVESASNTHALFVDAGNSSVSINSSDQMATGLHVTGPTSGEYRTLFVTNEADVTKGVCIAYDLTNDRGVITAVDSGTSWLPLIIENTSLTIDNGLVVNESGNNHDFRVESDSNANMLFVDAGQNNVGIGKAPGSGQGTLQTVGSTAATNYYRPAGQYHIFGESSGNGNDEWVYLGGSYTDTDKSVGYVMQDYNGNFGQYAGSYIRSNQAKVRIGHLVGGANSGTAPSLADNVIFDTAGGAVFNERGETGDFRVESGSNANMLFVNGGTDSVVVNGTTGYGGASLTVWGAGSGVLSIARNNLSGGSNSGATGLWAGDAGSGVVILARDKTNNNTADTVIYGEHGYNTQDERIRASRDYIKFRTAGTDRAAIDNDGLKMLNSSRFRQPLGVGYNTTIDTGISVNGGSASRTLLVLMSGHTSDGMNTQTALYLVRLGYDGNNHPVSEKIGGNYTINIGKSASNTVTLHSVSIPVYQIIEVGGSV